MAAAHMESPSASGEDQGVFDWGKGCWLAGCHAASEDWQIQALLIITIYHCYQELVYMRLKAAVGKYPLCHIHHLFHVVFNFESKECMHR
ncbi:hypothetical protein E4T56_gene19230 [Termitomyces sp. T112]|nr:hypothetical protein E4T56_gene19230 [Termitomyces sp. T112]